MEMADPWKVWEDKVGANQLLTRYAQKPPDAGQERLGESGEEGSPPSEPTDHSILLALGWVDIVWSELSPRGHPTGYKINGLGKEWLKKRSLPQELPE